MTDAIQGGRKPSVQPSAIGHPNAPVVPPLGLADWDHIDDPAQVAKVLSDVRQRPRFDVYRQAELYELAYPGYTGDLEYYPAEASTGPVLYLGVGAGRIFLPIAQRNPEALGIDSSPEMVSLLLSRSPWLRGGQVRVADVLTTELGLECFQTVVAPYSFLQVLDEPDVPAILAKVYASLRPGGRLLTDIFSPYLIPFRRPGLEASGRTVGDASVAIYILYDHRRQDMTELALIGRAGQECVLEMKLHYYFPRELERLIRGAGFPEVSVWGGYQREPFDPSSNESSSSRRRKGVGTQRDLREPLWRRSRCFVPEWCRARALCYSASVCQPHPRKSRPRRREARRSDRGASTFRSSSGS